MNPKLLPLLLAPAAILPALGAAAAELELTWSAGTRGEIRIERRADQEEEFSQIAVAGPGATRFVDSGLLPGGRYCYRVRLASDGKQSDYSEQSCAVAETTSMLPAVSSPPPSRAETAGDPRRRPGRTRAESGWLQVVPLQPPPAE